MYLLGDSNTAVGVATLQNNATGYGNSALGLNALYATTTGTDNVGVGAGALQGVSTADGNAALGFSALASTTTGSANTAIGANAGESPNLANANTTGSNNTFLGANAGPGTSAEVDNATAIGANATVSESNALVLGASGTNVGIGTSAPAHTLDVTGDVNGTTLREGGVALNQEYQGRYARTVVVSPVVVDGAIDPVQSGTALLAAMAGIASPAATNPFLLKLEPGTYDLGSNSLMMKSYVDIEGSGQDVTTVTSAVPGANCSTGQGIAATITGAANAEIRDLTVKATNPSYPTAISAVVPGPTITDVTLVTGTATTFTYAAGICAIYNYAASSTPPPLIIKNATITLPGLSIGIEVQVQTPAPPNVVPLIATVYNSRISAQFWLDTTANGTSGTFGKIALAGSLLNGGGPTEGPLITFTIACVNDFNASFTALSTSCQ